MKFLHLLLFSFCLIANSSFGQKKQYLVFFKDKKGSDFSIVKPTEFLSNKSIQRRKRQNIPLDSTDLPISKTYIEQIQALGFTPKHRSKWLNAGLYSFDSSDSAKVKALDFVTKIEYIAPSFSNARLNSRNNKFESLANSIIPFQKQANLVQNNLINIDILHNLGYKGKGITIAVFDAGFPGVDTISYFKHILNENRIIATKDFFTNATNVFHKHGHGTQVLSTMGAYKQDESYIGTAPEAEYILCITDDATEYRLDEYSWLFAAEYADSLGVDIINSSLGYTTFDDPSMNYEYRDMDGKTTTITKIAEITAAKGILVVNAVGNEGHNPILPIAAPADAANILSIGSINSKLEKGYLSSYGPTSDGRTKPDLVALGENTTLVNQNGKIIQSSGTSFASPIIAGMAASFWQAFPKLHTKEIIRELKSMATLYPEKNNNLGYGIPKLKNYNAINKLLRISEENNQIEIYPNPSDGEFSIATDIDDRINLRLYNLQMKEVFRLDMTKERHFKTNLKAGIYFILIESSNRKLTQKFVIY